MKYKTVTSKDECINAIRANMTRAGCSTEHIAEAIANHLRLRENGPVEVAILT